MKTFPALVRLRLVWMCALTVAVLGCSGNDEGSPASSTTTGSLTGRYLLAFHASDTAVEGGASWQTHQTYVAQSDDGLTWSILPGYVPYQGSVPDLIRRGNTLYVYNPHKLRRYRIDLGTWEDPIYVTMIGSDGTQVDYADPSPILDENGNIVLFHLAIEQIGSAPGGCPPGVTTCTKSFRSATEVPGSDGASFTVDSGDRAQVTITAPEVAADPDIFHDGSRFVLYISQGQSVLAFTSTTLRGSYLPAEGLTSGVLVSACGGVPSGHFDSGTGMYWTYVHTGQSGVSVIRRAVHGSLTSAIPESSLVTIISGGSVPGLGSTFTVESPGFTVNEP